MKSVLCYASGALAATLVQPLWMIVWGSLATGISMPTARDLEAFPAIVAFVSAYACVPVLLVGVPTFYVLRSIGKDNARWLAIVGFALVSVPFVVLPPIVALLFLLMDGGSAWSMWSENIGGGTSARALLELAGTVVALGLHGAFGALAFLWGWRLFGGKDAVATRAAGAPAVSPPA